MAGEYAVLGLGQFGRHVAISLAQQGQSVLAIDERMERVEQVKSQVDAAVQADATDEDALYSLEIETMTTVVVAIGANSTEASILTTALLAQVGVPKIIARASTDLHARVLRAVGAHEVVDPEGDMGERLAQRLSRPNVIDQLTLGDAVIAEVSLPESMVGQTLAELELRNQYDVSVIATQQDGSLTPNPDPTRPLESGEVFIVLGRQESIDALSALA